MLPAWIVALLLVHAAATLLMTGLIWFVQVVHYPLMGAVGTSEWIAYERRHQARTTLVVAPTMLVELACTLLIAGLCASAVPAPESAAASLARLAPLAWIGLLLLAVVWISTFGVQVPLHGRLGKGFDEALHRRLVASNWIRTGAWSARGLVALSMLWTVMR